MKTVKRNKKYNGNISVIGLKIFISDTSSYQCSYNQYIVFDIYTYQCSYRSNLYRLSNTYTYQHFYS